MGEPITVYKLGLAGEILVAYPGRVLARDAQHVVVDATFTRGPLELGYVTLEPGDRFLEYFYTDRWYNIFRIYAGASGRFKGWYCNITRPAEIVAGPQGELQVRAVDLALDYFRQPSGVEFVLDEDEFAALTLRPEEVEAARLALAELRALAAQQSGPFSEQDPYV